MTQRIFNPFPFFQDRQGLPLDGGNIYIGQAGTDPETSPVTTFWDESLTQVATQPIRTLGGLIVNGATPAYIYIAAENYSIRARDADGDESFYTASAALGSTPSQPLNAALTAISELFTTPFGRNLLTVGDAETLRLIAGIVSSLPTAGGPVTGNIVRAGSGTHCYYADSSLMSGREFLTAAGAADPTTLPGDKWFEKKA